MAKKTKKSPQSSRIDKVMDQVKEPFQLLETLKSEGIANATLLLGMATEAAKSFRLEQLKQAMHSFGFVSKADLERLEERLDELEGRIAELEGGSAGDEDE
ncbi:MAG: hypothetical protein HUU37_08565 [Bdellovibrionales bacterium]|nr:hypothetical protein [Bdellovibrionales bacterium]